MRQAAASAIEATSGKASPALIKVLQAEFSGVADPDETIRTAGALASDIRRAAIDAERKALIALWRNNEIGDEVLHHLEELLDYREAQLRAEPVPAFSMGRSAGWSCRGSRSAPWRVRFRRKQISPAIRGQHRSDEENGDHAGKIDGHPALTKRVATTMQTSRSQVVHSVIAQWIRRARRDSVRVDCR